jgi:hypothetical protein
MLVKPPPGSSTSRDIPIVGLISTTLRQPKVTSTCTRSRLLTVFFLNRILEEPWCKMTERVHRDDLLLVGPLGKWPNVCSRFGVGEIRSGELLV